MVRIEDFEFIPTERPRLTQLHVFKPMGDQTCVPIKHFSAVGLQQCQDIRELIEVVRAL